MTSSANTLRLIRLHPKRARALIRASEAGVPEAIGYSYSRPRPPTAREVNRYTHVPTEHLIWTAARLHPTAHALLRSRLGAIAVIVHATDREEWDGTILRDPPPPRPHATDDSSSFRSGENSATVPAGAESAASRGAQNNPRRVP